MNKKILIIGYGNFGKLMADKLSLYADIFVYDKNKISVSSESIKIIDKKNVSEMDYIIFAVPVQFLKDSVLEFKDLISKKSIILDVSSVKVFPLKILQKNFPENEVVGTHPLFGPESIAKKIPDLKTVISNISGTEKTVNEIKNTITKLGFGVVEMKAEDHDKQMALIQALSHLIGFSLREFNLKKDLPLKTLAYRSMYAMYENTKNDSRDLFETIQNFNPYARGVRQKFIKKIISLDKSCEDNFS